MVVSKRSREQAEFERSDEDDSEPEMGSSRSNARAADKRVRLSNGTAARSDESSEEGMDHNGNSGSNGNNDTDSSSDEMDNQYTYTYTAPQDDPSADIEIFGLDEPQENDGDEIQVSEQVREAMSKHQENLPSASGIIEEVSMRNFMCHARLTIAVGPLINFIVGHNGSGKSAILTALTICLGAKASVTNRAGSLKNFIKEGEDSAWVAVKLKNQGENAYQPDHYGRSIVVERHFSRAGTSSFKIKNAEGRLVSSKKSDLEDIVDFFALQIDNPMNVLSQDQARQFLSNSTPSDKYKFFIRGTQLEQLDKDYNLMSLLQHEIEAKCDAREADVAILGDRKRKAQEKKAMMDAAENIQTRINETRWHCAWAQVEELERRVAAKDADVRKQDQHVERAQRVADEASAVFEEEHQNHDANVSVIADLENALLPRQEAHREAKTRFDENRKRLTDAVAAQRVIKTDMKRHQSVKANVQTKIDAEHARIENANGPALAQKVASLEENRVALPALQDRLEQHRGAKAQLDRAVQQAEMEESAARPPIDQKKEELQKAEALLQRLEREKGDQTKAFPPAIHQVRRAIQNDSRFRDKPVGPIAMYITLKKPEWSTAIERTLGGQGDSFVVTCKQDQSILSQIMRKHNCHSNIIVGKSQHIDVSQNEPDPEVDTILRVVEIENDLVRNALIINQRIEQTVLIPRRAEANAYSQRRRPNVAAVISHHPTVVGQDIRFGTSRSGAFNNSPIPKWDRMIRIKTSAEEQMRLQRIAIQQARQDLEQLQQQYRQRQLATKTAAQAVNKHNNDAKKLREELQRTEDRVQQLEEEVSADNVNDTSVLDELRGQLQEAEKDHEAAHNSYMDSVNEKDAIDEANKQIKQEVDAIYKEVQEMETKIQKARDRADKRERSRHHALTKKNHALGLLEEAHREKNTVVAERDALAMQLRDEFIPGAEQVHPRVPVPPNQTPEMLDKKIDALIKEKDRFQTSLGGNREQIRERYHTANTIFKQATAELDRIKSHSELLKKSLLHRQGRWVLFRKTITSRAKVLFMYLLSERGFRGRLLVDHLSKALDISVEPDGTKSSDRGRQTKTLSGGEKSFSTICLLLSIWEAMGSPIRCLDEFDVFMDSANREISMKMIVQAARRSTGRQFIFITPQAMDAVKGWEDVRIFRMVDPERGQTTLPFGER